MTEVSEEERERIFQELWDLGSGFRFLFGGFADIATDEKANQAAIDFIHRKIREIVKDEQVSLLHFRHPSVEVVRPSRHSLNTDVRAESQSPTV